METTYTTKHGDNPYLIVTTKRGKLRRACDLLHKRSLALPGMYMKGKKEDIIGLFCNASLLIVTKYQVYSSLTGDIIKIQ